MLNQNPAKDPFSNKIRVRVCGILKEKNKILLLRHDSIGSEGYLWIPPGGGVDFGESLEECLRREFLEETNLVVEIGRYLFTHEFIGSKYHAIEIFFEVVRKSGKLKLGTDPELAPNNQILKEAKFFSNEELGNLSKNTLHNAFYMAESPDKFSEIKDLLTFKHLS